MSFDSGRTSPDDDGLGKTKVAVSSGYAVGWLVVLVLLVFAAYLVEHRLAPAVVAAADDARGPVAAEANRSGSAAIGSTAPDFPFIDLGAQSGGIGSLAATRGRPVWVNFFATWCPPCKAEMPDIERLYSEHQNDGFLVVGADQQESAALVNKFAHVYGLTFPLVIDPGDGALAFGVYDLPTSVFVDAGGTVRRIYHGQMSTTQMDAAVQLIHK